MSDVTIAASKPILMSSGLPCPLSVTKTAVGVERKGAHAAENIRSSMIYGEVPSSPSVHIKTGAVVHGNMSLFAIQDYVVVQEGAVLRPPVRVFINQGVARCEPVVNIGAFTVIGAETVCEAASVGTFVRIDERCVIGAGAVVPDGVWIRARSMIPQETVLAPYTVYEGCPAVPAARLGTDVTRLMQMEFIRECLGV